VDRSFPQSVQRSQRANRRDALWIDSLVRGSCQVQSRSGLISSMMPQGTRGTCRVWDYRLIAESSCLCHDIGEMSEPLAFQHSTCTGGAPNVAQLLLQRLTQSRPLRRCLKGSFFNLREVLRRTASGSSAVRHCPFRHAIRLDCQAHTSVFCARTTGSVHHARPRRCALVPRRVH